MNSKLIMIFSWFIIPPLALGNTSNTFLVPVSNSEGISFPHPICIQNNPHSHLLCRGVEVLIYTKISQISYVGFFISRISYVGFFLHKKNPDLLRGVFYLHKKIQISYEGFIFMKISQISYVGFLFR